MRCSKTSAYSKRTKLPLFKEKSPALKGPFLTKF